MADNILNNTLIDTMKYPTSPQLTGNAKQDIGTLQSAYHPGMTQAFSQVMQTVSRMAYNDRQQVETNQLNKQFDPTKVSGGTFADIMGWVEKNRGIDTSKVYGATMQGYQASQQEIGGQLDKLKVEEQGKSDELRQLKYQFPDADIKDADSEDTIALKIRKSNERKTVIDLYTQTFGSFPTGMSVEAMNTKLAKKYKNYDKIKQQNEIANLETGDVKTAEEKDKFISDAIQKWYDNPDYTREAIRDMINAKYPGSGDVVYTKIKDKSNRKETKKDDTGGWGTPTT